MPLPGFSDLTLVLTERCNLSCAFCYVPKRERTMPRELALQAVDLLLDRAPEGTRPSVGFFGGEPLLARELLAQVVAHGRRRRGRDIRFTMPTNGTLVDGPVAAELLQAGVELALSVDDATGAGQHTLEGVRPHLEHLRRFSPIVRMTVTPDNVENLLETVVRLFEAGFSRIMHQPALERAWPGEAVETWRAQHEALCDWACDRLARRLALPKLIVLEGIIARLDGRGASYCGAGTRTVAVDTQGRVFGCYRSVYDPSAERLVIADLRSGWVNEPLVAAYARLHPHRARPERGSCRSCDARDGCTVYCPAMGHVLLGDLRGVSADACRLMAIQVEICRDLVRRTRRLERTRRLRVGSRVAAAALALSLAGGGAGCDNDRTVSQDAAVDYGPGLCAVDMRQDTLGPGLCPPDMTWPDTLGPGLCPTDMRPDTPTPGLCPPPDDMMGPGLCPVLIDVGPGLDLPGPGLCPVTIDAQPGPGLCPIILDAGQPGPGLCPTPIPDAGKPTPGLC